MELQTLIDECKDLVERAEDSMAAGRKKHAERQMVELKELLDYQPELEAGGSRRQPSDKEVKNHDEI